MNNGIPGVKIGIAVAIALLLLIGSCEIFENVDVDHIMVVQNPVSGVLSWYTSGGIQWQWFGKVTIYPKRSIYNFEIPVRFNDGGHGTMFGSMQYEMPLDVEHLTALHVRFGSPEAIENQLIKTITNKSVYMTGPLMSSKESYAEKRNFLIFYVEDQIQSGVYRTYQKETKVKDAMSGVDKTVTVVEIAMKNGIAERQEEAILAGFGIKAFNFSIEKLPYDEAVETQIKQQQQIAMDVQTAIAGAKKAEQRFLTVTKEGEADAAKAKWDQEVIKARVITEAQQKLEVSRLDAQSAEQYKIAQLKRAEGDAGYKRQVMAADGALQQKLEVVKEISFRYADAIKDHQGPLVPTVVMGGGSGAVSHNSVPDLINLLTAKAARDVGIDLSVKGQQNTK